MLRLTLTHSKGTDGSFYRLGFVQPITAGACKGSPPRLPYSFDRILLHLSSIVRSSNHPTLSLAADLLGLRRTTPSWKRRPRPSVEARQANV